jgi:hypothetical protein
LAGNDEIKKTFLAPQARAQRSGARFLIVFSRINFPLTRTDAKLTLLLLRLFSKAGE